MNATTENPEGTGYERIKASKTLDEVLATAMSFERAAHEFYSSLKDRVSKPLRELVQELAQEEARHYALFEQLRRRADIQQHIFLRIQTPASDHRFSDYVRRPELGDFPDDQSLLQYALGREQAAMEQYGALARETPGGPIRELFEYLAEEELSHKAELEKRYYELVYATNV